MSKSNDYENNDAQVPLYIYLTDHPTTITIPPHSGLCRLSTLLLEDKHTQRIYRLERPLELYVTSSSQDEVGVAGASGQ